MGWMGSSPTGLVAKLWPLRPPALHVCELFEAVLRIHEILVRIRRIRGSIPLDSVADPDPDPHVFGPPGSGSGSTSQMYGSGSGSFYHHAKIVRKT
jgi:hypothetical protein